MTTECIIKSYWAEERVGCLIEHIDVDFVREDVLLVLVDDDDRKKCENTSTSLFTIPHISYNEWSEWFSSQILCYYYYPLKACSIIIQAITSINGYCHFSSHKQKRQSANEVDTDYLTDGWFWFVCYHHTSLHWST